MAMARGAQPMSFIDHALAPFTTGSWAIIVTDSAPDNKCGPPHTRLGPHSDSPTVTQGGHRATGKSSPASVRYAAVDGTSGPNAAAPTCAGVSDRSTLGISASALMSM